jgi:hypothetical protein
LLKSNSDIIKVFLTPFLTFPHRRRNKFDQVFFSLLGETGKGVLI